MFKVINFDNWIENDKLQVYGSGASEKIWLENPITGEKGLFKYPKIRPNQTITGEFWAEKLASEIGKLLNIECAKVDIGTYKGRLGSMSYNIIKGLENDTSLIEGVEFIQKVYPYYDKDKLKDSKTGDLYTVQMIEKSLKNIL